MKTHTKQISHATSQQREHVRKGKQYIVGDARVVLHAVDPIPETADDSDFDE